MNNAARWIGACSLAALMALYIVGAVSHGSLRHEVQTAPLWFPIVLGFRGRPLAKWTALPCLLVWLALMINIWLFLMGWAHTISGTFSPVEIALTVIIAAAAVCGIAASLRWRTKVSRWTAAGIFVLFLGLQLLAIRISFIPYIAHQ